MKAIPELVPLSALRTRQRDVLAKLEQGAALLTQRGRVVAVLVSPQQWNALHEDLQRLARALAEIQAAPPEETGDYYDFLGDHGLSSFTESPSGESDDSE